MDCTWEKSGDRLQLVARGRCIGAIVPFAQDGMEAVDELAPAGAGVWKWTRRFTARQGGAPRLTLDFVAAHRAAYALIPAVSYDGNAWGTGKDPKGFVRDGTPWSFAYHRTAVPGATYSEGADWSVALFGAVPAAACGFSCALVPEPERTVHRLIWPEEEAPLVYCARDEYGPAYRNALQLAEGQSFVVTAYLVVAPVERPRTAWHKLLDTAWALNYTSAPMPRAPQELWQIGVAHLKRDAWAEEGIFRGFNVGLMRKDGRWLQRPWYKYEIGWAGQNASLANALLADQLRGGDADSAQKGLATLDAWATHAPAPSGLIRCVFDPLLGQPRADVQDACNLGNAAECFLEGEQLARRIGAERPLYRRVALAICDFACRVQTPAGAFGKAWDTTGKCLDPHGTIGAYLIPALVRAHAATGDPKYLAAAEQAYAYYIGELLEHGFTTAGALDTHCIDKESAHPLVVAGLDLHAATGDPKYVGWVEDASYYIASWQWHHTIPCPPGGALAQIGYDSFGGTAVSTQHHHLDPYGIRLAGAWLKLAALTGKDLWRQRARAAWRNGMLGISDGNLTLMGALLPAGAQCEGYFHTRWLDYGNVSLWLVIWPTAFRLEVLRSLADWSPLA